MRHAAVLEKPMRHLRDCTEHSACLRVDAEAYNTGVEASRHYSALRHAYVDDRNKVFSLSSLED